MSSSWVQITLVMFAVCWGLAFAIGQSQPTGDARTTPSGLKIIEVKKVTEAMTAASGDYVWVHYTGRLQSNGTKFDSSLDRGPDQPFGFKLGTHQVIAGWDEGIAGMKVGDKRQLIIPPDLAYGNRVVGSITPNSTLVFDVELVGIYRP